MRLAHKYNGIKIANRGTFSDAASAEISDASIVIGHIDRQEESVIVT